VAEFVATTMGCQEIPVSFTHRCQIGRQVGQLPRDQVNDVPPPPLDAALDGHHAGGEGDAPKRPFTFAERFPDC
jgi:hypothetical protein